MLTQLELRNFRLREGRADAAVSALARGRGNQAKARPWVWFEEYARGQIQLEEQHIAEVEKMMRKPGELRPAG